MATINERLAKLIAGNEGRFEDDPQAFVVFTYKNQFNQNESCYAIAYTPEDFARYMHLEILSILWARDPIAVATMLVGGRP